jgi:hypothetical protein
VEGHVTLAAQEWLPLLRRLSVVSDRWAVWKNADRALAGSGDVDSVAPASDLELISREFSEWANERGYSWVVRCSHPGGMLMLIAVHDSGWAQLDLVSEMPYRGTRLFTVDQLRPLMVMDPRGFRRIRYGAEAFFLFLLKGTRRGGRPEWGSLNKYGVMEKMNQDWEGAEQAAGLLGASGASALRAARSASEGRWSQGQLIRVEALTAARALMSPRQALDRALVRSWKLPRCVVVQAVRSGRQPEALATWLRAVAEDHIVEVLHDAVRPK